MKRNSIFTQLVFGFLLSGLCLYALVVFFLYFTAPKTIENLSDDYLTRITSYTEENQKFALQVADPVEMQNIVDALTKAPWIDSATVSLTDFTQSFTAGNTEWEPGLDDFSAHPTFKKTDSQHHITKTIFITDSNSNLTDHGGYLHIAIDRHPLEELFGQTKNLFGAVSIGSLVIVVPLILLFAKRIARPVQSLGNQLEAVDPESTEYSQIALQQPPTEIQSVVDKVNKLLEKQHEYKENLEDKVSERTKELDIALDNVRKAEADKSAMMLNFSHDLKTPLTSAKGFLEFGMKQLRKGDIDGASESLDRAYNRVNDLSTEIQTLLQFSASTESELQPEPREFNLKRFMEDRFEELKPDFESSKNILSHSHSGRENIVTDEYMLRHIVENLINNSNKYCTDGEIRIVTHADSSSISITISDTGIGISADDLENIFKKHFQAKQSTRASSRGVGLGLTLCKQYTDYLKGSISVESTLNNGATFVVVLPMWVQAQDKPEQREAQVYA